MELPLAETAFGKDEDASDTDEEAIKIAQDIIPTGYGAHSPGPGVWRPTYGKNNVIHTHDDFASDITLRSALVAAQDAGDLAEDSDRLV